MFIPQKYIQGATAFPQVQLYPRDSANVIPLAHKAGLRVTLSARQPPLSYSLLFHLVTLIKTIAHSKPIYSEEHNGLRSPVSL